MSQEKNKNLLLYICDLASSQKDFGSVKLNKALWFSDMIHYLETGEFISSFKYIKQDKGPTPEPRSFLSLRNDMIESQELKYEPVDYFGFKLNRCQNIAKADLRYFKQSELDIIRNIVNDISNLNGSQLSEITHNLGWQKAKNGEEMTPKHFITTHKKLTSVEVEFLLDSYNTN